MRIAYTRPDGGLSIVSAAPKASIERVLGPLTDAEYRQHVFERSIPADSIQVHELADTWQPPDTDRAFRDAWTNNAGAIEVDMPKARELHRDKLRRLRSPKLAALDVEYMRALEVNNTTEMASVATRKAALRNVTADPAIEAAQTPETLKAVLPVALSA